MDGILEFQVGDKAVYPAQGVAEVVGIDSKEISGNVHKFYVLRVLDSDMRILVPVADTLCRFLDVPLLSSL